MLGRFRRRRGNKAKSATCPYCRADLLSGETTLPCPLCETRHHAECFRENGGCTVFGCGATSQEPRRLPWLGLALWGALVLVLCLSSIHESGQAARERAAREKAASEDRRRHPEPPGRRPDRAAIHQWIFGSVTLFLGWARDHEGDAKRVASLAGPAALRHLEEEPGSATIVRGARDLEAAREAFRSLVQEGDDPLELAAAIRKETTRRVPGAPPEILDDALASLPETR